VRKLPQSAFLCAGLVIALMLAYANHFDNGFHFDDVHTVTGNPFIRSLSNVPRFFVDTAMFSTMPDHQVYRPVTMVTLAVDYWLGRGLKPFWFHLSTFVWLTVQVILMFFLFRRMMDAAHPHPSNQWTAWFAAAWYGLHPACAETVNYVIQRADLLSTVGIMASVLIFARYPERRRQGWYLIPALLATFAKTPALIFPAILLAYLVLIEKPGRWSSAIAAAVPATIAAAVSAAIQAQMTPAGFNAGAASGLMYRITQPYVTLYYFKSFFLPTELSADTDWGYVPGVLSSQAMIGYLFLAGLVWAIVRTSRTRETRPIAFGLAWFLLGLLPTAMMPLAEVMNDHRMYLPFVGLALAVTWTARLVIFRRVGQITRPVAAAALAVLAAFGAGTHERNRVWHDEESLWRDVVAKSPNNGRGMMNYGLIFMQRGDYQSAIAYMERALPLTPNYWSLETNLGVAYGDLRRDDVAERHFLRASALAPGFAEPHYFYARWLDKVGRTGEAAAQLEAAIKLNPQSFDARDLLIAVYSKLGNWTGRERIARETLQLAPGDEAAKNALAQSADRTVQLAPPPVLAAAATPEALLQVSHQYFQAGQYEESIAAAKKALELRPEWAEAYNNIAAANNALHRWNEGIWAAMQAVRIKPDYQLARNNLAWGMTQKTRAQK
jgi:tetratricopeptide (TPR) repeat protein